MSALNDVVATEKDTREVWINRFEKEQKSHIATSNELLHTKGVLQDAQLKLKNQEIAIESVTKQRDLVKLNNQDLQKQLTELMSVKETAERELFSKSELLRTVEDQHLIYARKLQQDMKAMKQQKDWELQGKLMQYEDMRTYAGMLFREGEDLKRRIEEALHTLSTERDSKARLQIQYTALTESFQGLSTKYTETTELLSMTQRTNSDLV